MKPEETVEVLFTAEQIDARIMELAEEINNEYGEEPITLIGALSGGVMFLSDLARKLGNNVTIDFIRASSYGDSTVSGGTVHLDTSPRLPIGGKNVIIVEDIIDTGHTITYLRKHLKNIGATHVKVCALLDKPSRRVIMEAKADYTGFVIEDKFVVGYGLDYAQRYRNLPYIGILSFNE